MAETATAHPLVGAGPGDDVRERAAAMAGRLADLVDATCSPQSEARQTVAFLRTWARGVVRPTRIRPDASPLDGLVERYRLTAPDIDLLVLAGLAEEHEGLAGTFRAMHPAGEPRPTLGLAALLCGGDAASRDLARRLGAPAGVIGRGLVRLTGDRPLFEQSITVAPALWSALHGHDVWPDQLRPVPVDDVPPGLARWLRLPAVRRAARASRQSSARTIVAACHDLDVALARFAALAADTSQRLVAVRLAPGDEAGLRLASAHAAARQGLLLLCLSGSAEPDRDGTVLDLGDLPGPVLVHLPPGAARLAGSRPLLALPTGPVDSTDQRRAWREGLPQVRGGGARLAARHPLDPALVAAVAADLRSQRELGAVTTVGEVAVAVRTRASITLPAGATLSRPGVGWDRLVLPPDALSQLRDAVDRLDHQGTVLDSWGLGERARARRGVRLLLAGPPGTGKTLAAEVLATAAGTDLLVVDVARIVSKWLGETEKNLSEVFDAAERTQAVLLLDEADALFGSRTQVGDAHDRYANLETAYLLQRMERFDGVVVLASNLRRNIDAAFVRRLDVIVELGLPSEREREQLWRLHLPSLDRLDGVDVAALARLYPVPGAWIRNVALASAYLAAPDGVPIRPAHISQAMRREYAKASRPFPGEPRLPDREEDA